MMVLLSLLCFVDGDGDADDDEEEEEGGSMCLPLS